MRELKKEQFYNKVGEFNTPLSIRNKTAIQKINQEKEDTNNVIKQLDLTDLHRPSSKQQQNTHSSLGHMEHSQGEPYVGPQNKFQ